MSKRSGKYSVANKPLKKLNTTVPPIRVKSTNAMKKKSSKSFVPKVRASSAPTNKSKKAVSKVNSGRPGSGRTFAYGTKGIDKRVMQISPAQFSSNSKTMSRTVAETPRKQNKSPSLNMMKKSLRKTMGY